MRVVFDTNVYISALIVPGSKGERAFLLARRGRVLLYSSVSILTETANVLRTKFNQSESDIKAAVKAIGRAAEILRPSRRVTVLQDLPDNRILECAAAARADLIVTGDRHLSALEEFERIPIVRLADFLRRFPPED